MGILEYIGNNGGMSGKEVYDSVTHTTPCIKSGIVVFSPFRNVEADGMSQDRSSRRLSSDYSDLRSGFQDVTGTVLSSLPSQCVGSSR